MKVDRVELYRLELELVRAVKTAKQVHARRPVLIVRVHIDGCEGFGECSALAEPTYTEEYADGAQAVLVDHLLPRLLGDGAFDSVEQALDRLSPVRGHAMAKAAIEMALLDCTLRMEGRSLAQYLGATQTRVAASATIGIGEAAQVLADVDDAVRDGYRHVKVKVAPGRDIAALREVRERYPALGVSIDANGAYERCAAEHLDALDALALDAIEQPLSRDDLVSHARLAQRLTTPVILDESIPNEGMLDVALALQAMDGISVKASRLGGLLAARRVHDRCVAAGVACALGGMFETGLGRAAQLALGGLAGFSLPGDLGASERYFARDITEAHVVTDGYLAIPSRAGLGVEVDLAALEGRCAMKRVLQAP